MTQRTFRRATARDPCPICGRAASCSQAPSGARFCWGVASSVRGWRHVRTLDNGFSLFWPDEEATGFGAAARHEPARRPAPEARADPEELARMLGAHKARLLDHQFLGDHLGIHHSGVARLGMARVAAEDKRQGYWLLPERDERGVLVGLQRRYDDGKKLAVTGSRRGLVYELAPDGREPVGNAVLVVEGYSDTAAALSVGLWAVGRPSNLGGAAMLGPLLQFAAQRLGTRVVVVGENDRKESGLWPGRDGAERVARSLADMLGVTVHTAFPPEGVKDLRAWVKRELPRYRGRTREERAGVGRRLLDALTDSAGAVEPDPAGQRLPPLELPQAPAYPAAVGEVIAAGTGSMPCPSHAVPILQKRSTPSAFAAIMARCRRWSCPVCQHARRSAWLTHLLRRFEAAPALHAVEADDDAWKRLGQAVRHAKLDYVRVQRRCAPALAITSGPVKGSRALTLAEAGELAAAALLAVDVAHRKAVNSSRGWALRLDDRPAGDYLRRGQAPRGGFGLLTDRLRGRGIEPHVSHDGETGRANWTFPPDYSDEQAEEALDILQAPRHASEAPDGMDEW